MVGRGIEPRRVEILPGLAALGESCHVRSVAESVEDFPGMSDRVRDRTQVIDCGIFDGANTAYTLGCKLNAGGEGVDDTITRCVGFVGEGDVGHCVGWLCGLIPAT